MKNVQTTKKSRAKSTTPAVSEASGSLTLKSKVTENDFRDPRVRALAIAAKSYMRFEIAVNNAFPLLTLPNLRNDLIWKVINATMTKTPSLEVAVDEAKKSEVLETLLSKFVWLFKFHSASSKKLTCIFFRSGMGVVVFSTL
jgi:hypothetical protein